MQSGNPLITPTWPGYGKEQIMRGFGAGVGGVIRVIRVAERGRQDLSFDHVGEFFLSSPVFAVDKTYFIAAATNRSRTNLHGRRYRL